MLDISFVKRTVPADEQSLFEADFLVQIDGQDFPKSGAYNHLGQRWSVHLSEPEAVRRFCNCSPKELPEELLKVGFDIESSTARSLDFTFYVDVVLHDAYPEILRSEPQAYKFTLATSLADWSNPWTFAQLYRRFQQLLSDPSSPSLETRMTSEDGDQIDGVIAFSSRLQEEVPVSEVIASVVPTAERLLARAHDDLLAHARENSLVTLFDFPPAIRNACQQYLIYFVQFLRDLGIEAKAEIKESHSGKVLFNVTPKDGKEALEAVSNALRAYLDFPGSPNAVRDAGNDIAVRELRAQLRHLEGQLELKAALLQAKDVIIAGQEYRISQYQVSEQMRLSKPRAASDDEPLANAKLKVGASANLKVVEAHVEVSDIGMKATLNRLFRRF